MKDFRIATQTGFAAQRYLKFSTTQKDTVIDGPVVVDDSTAPRPSTLGGNCDALLSNIKSIEDQMGAKMTAEAYANLQNQLTVAKQKFEISGCTYPATGGTTSTPATNPPPPGPTQITVPINDPIINVSVPGNTKPVTDASASNTPGFGGGAGGGAGASGDSKKKFNWWIIVAAAGAIYTIYQTNKAA